MRYICLLLLCGFLPLLGCGGTGIERPSDRSVIDEVTERYTGGGYPFCPDRKVNEVTIEQWGNPQRSDEPDEPTVFPVRIHVAAECGGSTVVSKSGPKEYDLEYEIYKNEYDEWVYRKTSL